MSKTNNTRMIEVMRLEDTKGGCRGCKNPKMKSTTMGEWQRAVARINGTR